MPRLSLNVFTMICAKIKAPADWVSVNPHFRSREGRLPAGSSQGGRDEVALWSLCCKGANPTCGGSALLT